MPAIILLKVYRQPRYGDMVSVEFDDGTVAKVDPEIVVTHRVCTGKVLGDDEVAALCKAQENLESRRTLVKYLQVYRRTEGEAREYLRRRKFRAAAVDSAVAAAHELGLINDVAYANDFAQSRTTCSKHGILRVRYDLKNRGVRDELINTATSEVGSREVQLEQARELAQRRRKSFPAGLELAAQQRRLAGLLSRRGFQYEIVAQVLHEILNTPDD